MIVRVLSGFSQASETGERCVANDPGEGQGNEFLPTTREGFLEIQRQIPEFPGQEGGVPVLPDGPGRPCTARPLG